MAVHDELRQLRAEVEELRRRLDEREQPTEHDDREEPPVIVASRRTMFKAAGLIAAGAVVGTTLDGATPAAAADPNDIEKGAINSAGAPTELNYNGAAALTRNVFTVQQSPGFASSAFPAAIGAFGGGGGDSKVLNGAYCFADQRADSTTTGHALIASISGAARSHMLLNPRLGDPRTDSYAHLAGEIRVDTARNMWFCDTGGTPGTWTLLAGPGVPGVTELDGRLDTAETTITELDGRLDTAETTITDNSSGRFVALEPGRVYDSRINMAPVPDGLMSPGDSYVIPVDARRSVGGQIVESDFVPSGSSAIAYNVTIAGMSGLGFLTVSPGDATEVGSSTINWGASTSGALANSSIVKITGQREIKVFCEGAGSTHVIVDVLGYFT